jgi:outer membrane biosynthesis protein TonB
MEKKEKITVYLPQKLYVEVFDRQLAHHFSHLVSLLVEAFIRSTDVRISWAEMPNRADQRMYLERKVREFLSRAGFVQERTEPTTPVEPPKPPVQERTESIHMQERPKDNYSATKSEPVKEETPPPPKEKT